MGLSNKLWSLSAEMKEWADSMAEAYMYRHGTRH